MVLINIGIYLLYYLFTLLSIYFIINLPLFIRTTVRQVSSKNKSTHTGVLNVLHEILYV